MNIKIEISNEKQAARIKNELKNRYPHLTKAAAYYALILVGLKCSESLKYDLNDYVPGGINDVK
jgi:hypothetical protein